MLSGGKKFVKPVKTKFKKTKDQQGGKHIEKQKHHDKSFYRLAKQEKEEYVV